MLVGYARTSTVDQIASVDHQRDELGSIGCEKVFVEQVSSVATRLELEAALDFIREGDTLVVSRLDRLARSVADLTKIVGRVQGKGASLRILNINLDTGTATGKLMLNMLGAIAEFEREMLLERQKIGIARAKAEGRYKGRQPTARAKADDVRRLKGDGLGPSVIASRLGISRASVYRCLSRADEDVLG